MKLEESDRRCLQDAQTSFSRHFYLDTNVFRADVKTAIRVCWQMAQVEHLLPRAEYKRWLKNRTNIPLDLAKDMIRVTDGAKYLDDEITYPRNATRRQVLDTLLANIAKNSSPSDEERARWRENQARVRRETDHILSHDLLGASTPDEEEALSKVLDAIYALVDTQLTPVGAGELLSMQITAKHQKAEVRHAAAKNKRTRVEQAVKWLSEMKRHIGAP